MGRGEATRRRKRNQEKAALLKGQRVPAASDTKKPKKDAGDEGLTRAMKKMLALKQVAASKAVGGRMNAPQQPNQLQQRQRQDRAQPGAPGAQPEQQQLGAGQQREPARGHEAPAAGAQQGPQVPQAKAPQGKQGPDSLFQQKRLKDKKKEYLKQKKLKKKGKGADPLLTEKEAAQAARTAATAPRLGETAYQPLKVQLKRKHWAGEGAEAATASKRCTEIFERQMATARAAAAAAEAARDDGAVAQQAAPQRKPAPGGGGSGGKKKRKPAAGPADEAVRQQLIEAYRHQKQSRLEAAGKAPLLSATAKSLAELPASHERMRSGPRWLWLGVAWMVHDCVASIKAVPEAEMPERERGSSSGGSGGGSGGGSPGSDASGVLAVLVDKFSLRFFKFQRGELVVLRSPEEPERRLVRRLVAVEEDHVAVAGPAPGSRAQGHCWCEADAGARAVGGDSRLVWGPVPLALIEGRVTRVLWPPSRWCVLPPQPSLTRVVGKGGTLEFLQPPSREQDWWS
ncbi:hypothetical protein COHA_008912 [Chlorella ohadii]|uniref:Mitochondrial inner membrane protease subunit 2 n=1 Tax=Chlorella ohadii TaxID=2649997 RepID=A0AAD5DJ56_9CHLO|nr:hypothetical protein COHA_008912 [Chlorella ohadii]